MRTAHVNFPYMTTRDKQTLLGASGKKPSLHDLRRSASKTHCTVESLRAAVHDADMNCVSRFPAGPNPFRSNNYFLLTADAETLRRLLVVAQHLDYVDFRPLLVANAHL